MKPAMFAIVATGIATGLATGALTGCVDHKDAITGTQSIGVELVSPSDPGSVMTRLGDDARTVRVNLTAYDADKVVDTGFDRDIDVYAQFLGTLTPSMYPDPGTPAGTPAPAPLTTIHVTAGVARDQLVTLPAVFGPTTLWFDDHEDANPTYATGTSPTLWFRDPTIADIQTPTSLTSPGALTTSPLENKQVTVTTSRYGTLGRLVVNGVYSQGYTVSDVKCADSKGTPPCTSEGFNHIVVFSFSQPADQNGQLLKQGQLIDGFSGGISEFNGLTEVGFPVTFTSGADATVDVDRLPKPEVFQQGWFAGLSDPNGRINFERNEGAPIEIDNAKVCNLDSTYATFKQWKLDPAGVGGACSNNNVINVVTAGTIDLDPATLVGKTLPRVVGVLRPVSTSQNIWIIFPRSTADLTLQ